MGFYQDRILPHLVNLAMRNHRLLPYRERVSAAANGRVLEFGIGSGLNVPFLFLPGGEVFGLEPAPRLMAACQSGSRSRPARPIAGAGGEEEHWEKGARAHRGSASCPARCRVPTGVHDPVEPLMLRVAH